MLSDMLWEKLYAFHDNKMKVKFSLEQAKKVHDESRGMALLFL